MVLMVETVRRGRYYGIMKSQDPELIPAQTAMRMLGVSRYKFYDWVRKNIITPIDDGAHERMFYSRTQVEKVQRDMVERRQRSKAKASE